MRPAQSFRAIMKYQKASFLLFVYVFKRRQCNHHVNAINPTHHDAPVICEASLERFRS